MNVIHDGFQPLVADALAVDAGHVAVGRCVPHDVVHGDLIAAFAADRLKGVSQGVEPKTRAMKLREP